MKKTYKHRVNGTIATYKDGVFKQGLLCVEIGCEPSEKFWEDITTDYEILSVITTYSSYKPERVLTIEEYFKRCPKATQIPNDLVDIQSVKYLPTGEVFTIGDKARTIGKYPHKIKSIKIMQKQIDRTNYDGVNRIWLNWENDAGGNWLESTEKVKEAIFTTEDGVDIFENDVFYYIGDAGNICETSCLFKGDGDFSRFKVFAKKENAEEYIIMNKPCLSLNDLLANWGEISCRPFHLESPLFQSFKNFAKNKIENDNI